MSFYVLAFMSVLLVMCCVPSCDTICFAFIASINASFQLSGHKALIINGICPGFIVNFLNETNIFASYGANN